MYGRTEKFTHFGQKYRVWKKQIFSRHFKQKPRWLFATYSKKFVQFVIAIMFLSCSAFNLSYGAVAFYFFRLTIAFNACIMYIYYTQMQGFLRLFC